MPVDGPRPTREQLTPADALDRGRRAYARQAWAEAFELLSMADRAGPIELEDIERLGIAAHMLGRDDDLIALLGRGHQESLRAGDVSRAARSAFWLAMEHLGRGEAARAGGWLARAERVIDEGKEERVEQGYLLLAVGARMQAEGDAEAALATYRSIGPIAERFEDPDLAALARLGQGQALIANADTARGVALLDETMVAVTAGELSPMIVGIVYCSVIEACQGIFDLRRAQEWTAALDQWCESQPELVQYRGQCRLYRAELLQFHGAWQDADAEARRARERLGDSPGQPVGEVLYQQAELHRLRGELPEAEAAYRQASRSGRRPEPGLALLRLAQGRPAAAAAGIRSAVEEARDRGARPRLLGAYVEIMLATGDVAAARVAAGELALIAREVGAPLLGAMAALADGTVLLAEGSARAGLAALRRAWSSWHALDAPYEAARVRVMIARASGELGDEDSAALELDAAREVFRQLGARVDLARLEASSGRPASASGGLTGREVEVLRLVAAGKTNRVIAQDLLISEKTVARHLSNIYTKLDLSSRAAATAYAYEHDLLPA